MRTSQTANPYAPPTAGVAGPAEQGAHGRPLPVWVITIFTGFGVTVAIATTAAWLFGVGGEAFAAYMKRISPLTHLMGLTGTALAAWAAFELFRLKRIALPIYVLAFMFGLAVFGINVMLRPEYRAVLEQTDSWKLAMRWMINLAIIGYVWRLRARGILTR